MAKRVTMYRRMVIYKEAIKYIKKEIRVFGNYKNGICKAIDVNISLVEPNPYKKMECYPEIYRHKPEVVFPYNYWFPRNAEGLEKRLEILRSAIEEIQVRLKKNKKKYKI